MDEVLLKIEELEKEVEAYVPSQIREWLQYAAALDPRTKAKILSMLESMIDAAREIRRALTELN